MPFDPAEIFQALSALSQSQGQGASAAQPGIAPPAVPPVPDAVSGVGTVEPGPINPYPDLPPPKPVPPPTRDELLSSPADFSAAGGVVNQRSAPKSREELAKLQAGAGKSAATSALFDTAAQADITRRQADRSTVEAGHQIEDAQKLSELADKYYTEADTQLKDWQRRNKLATEAKVDPHHYFNQASSFTQGMWLLSFLSAGFTGNTANLQLVMGALNNTMDRDISAQKTNIETTRAGLNAEFDSLKQGYTAGQNNLATQTFEKQQRLNGLTKALDAEIARVGADYAEKSGMLKTRAALDAASYDLQAGFQKQIYEEAKIRTQAGLDDWRASQDFKRAKELKGIEFENASKLKAQDQANKVASTPALAPSLGATLVGPDGQPLRMDVGGEGDAAYKRAQDGNEVMNSANKRYTNLLTLKEHMPTTFGDLIRGGDAEFRAALIGAAYEQAKENDPSARITDVDYAYAAKQILGIDVSGGIGSSAAAAAKLPGDTFDDLNNRVDSQIRALPEVTSKRLQSFVNPDILGAGGSVVFEPQDLRVAKPAPDTRDETNLRVSGGKAEPQDTPALPAKLPKREVTGTYTATRVGEAVPAPVGIDQNTWDSYSEATKAEILRARNEKSKRESGDQATQGVTQAIKAYLDTYDSKKARGKLPVLSKGDEEVVDLATTSFKNAGADGISSTVDAAWQNDSLSDEAKLRITAEATDAIAALGDGSKSAALQTVLDNSNLTAEQLKDVQDSLDTYNEQSNK